MKLSANRMLISPIIASIAFVLELTLVPLLLPVIRADLGLGIGDMAWFFNSYGIAVALGVSAGGWVGDALGARRIFGAGALMFASGAIIVAVSHSFEMLLAGRILQGLGGGFFSPLVPVLLTRAMPDRPGKILIIWGSIAGYVAACAPLAVGWTVTRDGWPLVFMLFASLAGAALLLAGKGTPKPPEPARRIAPNPRILMGTPQLWVVFGYIFCTYGAITYYLFRLPLLLTEMDFDLNTIGMVLAAMWLSFSILGTLLRNWVDGHHVRKIVLIAPVLIAASVLMIYDTSHIGFLILSAILMGAGFACSNAPSTQFVLKFAPDGLSGLSMSLDITSARLGGVVAVAFLTPMQFGQSFVAVVGLCAVAFLCALTCMDKEPNRASMAGS